MEKNIFTTYEISKFCNVDLSTVINWVNRGRLKAYKTPGRHRRVKREDLLDFLKRYNMPVPKGFEGRYKVLVLDGDATVTRLVKRAFQKDRKRIDLRFSRDGFDGGKQIGIFHPDILVLDLKSRGIDGFKVCKNIKEDPATRRIKILAIGTNNRVDRKRIIASGADSFIAMPLDVENLLAHINKFK